MTPLTYEEFQNYVRASKRAWHAEFKDTYNVAAEDEPFRRFKDGEHDSYEWLSGWLDFVREVTKSGVKVQRARLVSVPHCDYTRWGITVAPLNISAGEDLRYVPRALVADVELPEEDYWLFDDDLLVLSIFTDDGRQGGFAREPDPHLTERCRYVRDQIWSRAIPYADYVSSTR